jgi:hypothetical protein
MCADADARRRSVQHGLPAKEGILVKSHCLLWRTLTLVGALQPWFDESLRILQKLVGDLPSVQQWSPAKERILFKSHCLLWMTLTLVGRESAASFS